jgi:hypothetical protein
MKVPATFAQYFNALKRPPKPAPIRLPMQFGQYVAGLKKAIDPNEGGK